MPNYHIRVHDTLDASSGIVAFLTSISDVWVITAEGAYYDKVQHRHIRPHYHCWLQYVGAHATLREKFKSAFPDYKGNKSYSIKSQKKEGDNLLSYILKGGNIIGFKGITLPELLVVPDWVDKKTHFRSLLKKHLKEWLLHNCIDNIVTNYIHNNEHFRHLFFMQITIYSREKDKWISKNDYYKLAYELEVIDTDFYTHWLT